MRSWRSLALGLLALSLVAFVAACSGDDAGTDQPAAEVANSRDAAGTGTDFGVAPNDSAAAPSSPSSGTVAEPDSADPSTTSSSILDRKVVQDGQISLKVKDVQPAFDAVSRIATSKGGMVFESSFYSEKDYRVGTLTVRVPADKYQEALSEIRAQGLEVISESASSSDVTGEYTDLNSRLRNLEASETQYLALLGEADTIDEILIVQDRLNVTRGEIEVIKGRLQQIDNLTSLATLRVELRPEAAFAKVEPETKSGFSGAVAEGWERSLDLLGSFGEGAVTAAVFSWWLVVPVLVLAWLARRLVANRPQHAAVVDTTSGHS